MASNENVDTDALKSRIDKQANLVRQLKSDTNSNKVCHAKMLNNIFSIFLSGRTASCSSRIITIERTI
jgi:hypothetical protein